MEPKDEELILEYQQGNTNAMEMLFVRHKQYVFNYAFRILANRADAEDVTADVFVRLFDKKYEFRPDTKFTTWLFTVVRNACIDRIRKRKKVVSWWVKSDKGGELQEWVVEDSRNTVHEELIKEEISQEIQRAIHKLPLNQKEALILREYHNLNYQQISEVMQCSVDNVKILIFRARESLRKELSSFMQEGYL